MSQLSVLPDSERKGADNNEQEKKDGGQIYSRNCAIKKCKENIQRPEYFHLDFCLGSLFFSLSSRYQEVKRFVPFARSYYHPTSVAFIDKLKGYFI